MSNAESIESTACACVARVNRGLAKADAELACVTSPRGDTLPVLLTSPTNGGSHIPIVITANFCPFCGLKLSAMAVCSKN